MSAEGGRPGGWVNGIGWVARLRDLSHDTIAANPDGRTALVRIHLSAGVTPSWGFVTVTHWPDGTAPEPPVCDATAAEPDPFATLRSYVQSWKDNAALAGKVAANSARADGLWDAYDRVLRRMDKLAGGES